MLYSLTGTVRRLASPHIAVDVNGVGYLVTVTAPVWQNIVDGSKTTILLHSYIREDRFDLYGFLTEADRTLFVELLGFNGVGPKTALEMCSIPKQIILQAVAEEDASVLTQIKGIGKKTAEKLLVDLKSLKERRPEHLETDADTSLPSSGNADMDAVEALTTLGYDRATALKAVKKVPANVKRTEDRVTAALRSL
jgi:Holliday junction DNA helicase RuvA